MRKAQRKETGKPKPCVHRKVEEMEVKRLNILV